MATIASASSYLTPRIICLSIAASSASAGRLAPDALPVLSALVSSQPSSAPTFRDLIYVLEPLLLFAPSSPASSVLSAASIADESVADESVAEFLDATVSTIDCVEALLRTVDNLVPPDPDEGVYDPSAALIFGVYDRDGTVACLLRTVVAMTGALSFEATADLVTALALYVSGTETPPSPSLISTFALPSAAKALSSNRPAPLPAFKALLSAPPAYGSHLESLRRRDASSALSSLHRHFDLSLKHLSPSSDARGHQHAALALAAAHFHLGHTVPARAALHDALRAAQHCGDDACAAAAQAWIARTSTNPGRRYDLFRHARHGVALAREEVVAVITPAARAARVEVADGGGDGFWRAEMRVQAAVAKARMGRVFQYVGCRAGNMSVEALLVAAAAWETHAALPTAIVVARMALRKARRRQAVPAKRRLQRGLMGDDDDAPDGREQVLTGDEALAIVAVASLEAKASGAAPAIAMLLDLAHSEDCDRIKLDFAPDQSSSRPERERLVRAATWLQFELALRRGETCVAGGFVETIAAYVPPASTDYAGGDAIGGADAELDAIEVRVRWHMSSQAFEEAVKDAELLSLRAASLSQPARVIDGSRFLADALIGAGAANSAIPHALSAVSLARGLGLEAAHVRSVLTLTAAMLRMDGGGSAESAAAASRTLDAVLPRALEGLGAVERGTARRLQAECALARAEGGREDVADEVVDALRDAIDAFGIAEDRYGLRDCWYVLARVYHEIGNVEGRSEASKAFRVQVDALAEAQLAFTP